MFVIRPVRIDDLPLLLKLARMVHFINLPADQQVISDKISLSRQSFTGRIGNWDEATYMFVIEDDSNGGVIGTSQIVARMGTPESPNTFFKIREQEMFADDLQIGTRHQTLHLGADDDGPTEIGGLILQPAYRGHAAKLGKQLSLVRFHYIGLFRDRFRDEMLAEMMAPLTSHGTNAFWEYLGRRFINLSYDEADRLSTRTKNFILSLLPHDPIHVTLLPPEARMIIGNVGKDTVPARVMLERLGFEYRRQIDPFDGGPHLQAKTGDIPLVRDTKRVKLSGTCRKNVAKGEALVSNTDVSGGFRGVRTGIVITDKGKSIEIPRDCAKALEAEPGQKLGLTILRHPDEPKKRRSRKR